MQRSTNHNHTGYHSQLASSCDDHSQMHTPDVLLVGSTRPVHRRTLHAWSQLIVKQTYALYPCGKNGRKSKSIQGLVQHKTRLRLSHSRCQIRH